MKFCLILSCLFFSCIFYLVKKTVHGEKTGDVINIILEDEDYIAMEGLKDLLDDCVVKKKSKSRNIKEEKIIKHHIMKLFERMLLTKRELIQDKEIMNWNVFSPEKEIKYVRKIGMIIDDVIAGASIGIVGGPIGMTTGALAGLGWNRLKRKKHVPKEARRQRLEVKQKLKQQYKTHFDLYTQQLNETLQYISFHQPECMSNFLFMTNVMWRKKDKKHVNNGGIKRIEKKMEKDFRVKMETVEKKTMEPIINSTWWQRMLQWIEKIFQQLFSFFN